MFEIEKIHCLNEAKAEAKAKTREFTFSICIWELLNG